MHHISNPFQMNLQKQGSSERLQNQASQESQAVSGFLCFPLCDIYPVLQAKTDSSLLSQNKFQQGRAGQSEPDELLHMNREINRKREISKCLCFGLITGVIFTYHLYRSQILQFSLYVELFLKTSIY